VVAAACVVAVSAIGAGAPKLPKAPRGQNVSVLAQRIPTPTAIAYGDGHVFVAGYGNEDRPAVKGGVYVLAKGKARLLPGSPAHAFGLLFAGDTLYISAGPRLLGWSGWNGSTFTDSRVVATGPNDFTGFNGLAMGRNGLIYAGVRNPEEGDADYNAGTTQFANDVITVDPANGSMAVVATGIRQPWQLLFAPGHYGPLVTDLGQDNLGKKRPSDWVIEAKPGDDFGFPACPARPAACAGHAAPFLVFPPHSSPMGLAYLNGKLYVALFDGIGGSGPEVVTTPIRGGKATPFLTGFPAPIIALSAHKGLIYVGDQAGTIYSVKP
jgi:glucose/arabinose dehydrogenase